MSAPYKVTTAPDYTPSPWGAAWDAAQLAPSWYPEKVERVHLRTYGPRDFGPAGDVYLADGRVKWVSFPGGMRHSAFYAEAPS